MSKDGISPILKVIVGSQAHGLATPQSDFDYRGVFVVPTSQILKLGGAPKNTSWIEGNDDDTSWEIGHFLQMAIKSNPTVLETFLAPDAGISFMGGDRLPYPPEIIKAREFGEELRSLFPYVWNSDDVKNAFIGYGLNQRKKFFENQDNRAPKYATAYLRVLYNAWELLSTGTFSTNFSETPIYEQLKRFKRGEYEIGEVIQTCYDWQTRVELVHKKMKKKESDVEKINEFLLKVRKHYWDA